MKYNKLPRAGFANTKHKYSYLNIDILSSSWNDIGIKLIGPFGNPDMLSNVQNFRYQIPDIKILDIYIKISDIKFTDIQILVIKIADVKIPVITIQDIKIPDIKILDIKIPEIKISDIKNPDIKSENS